MNEASKDTMPKWRPAPDDMVQTFGEMVRPLPGVEVRKMFGCPCAFYQGQMLAGVHGQGMFLRLAEEDRGRFLALEGAARFEPRPGRPSREYVVVPPAMLDQLSEVAPWLDRALAYVATLPPKDPKKARKSAKVG